MNSEFLDEMFLLNIISMTMDVLDLSYKVKDIS
jgi:hypothetical protein